MTLAFEFDVFLSHSSQDKPAVQALAQRLKQDGVRVWFDEWEIQPGDSIFSKIEYGLEHARLLLFFMSKSTFTSDWATLEHQTTRFRDPLNKTRRFIPIRLDDTAAPGTLNQFKYIDWCTPSEAAYQQLKAICLAPNSNIARAPTQQTTVDNIAAIPAVATQTSFIQFAQTWPHSRKHLQLAFVNPKHQAIHTAQTHADPALCSDVILRVQTQTPGHLVLFVQDDAGTCFQCYPNTPEQTSSAAGHSPSNLPAGEYFLPGELLRLPSRELGIAVQRLYFNDPGTEFALAFLCPTLPPCIAPANPIQAVSEQAMHTMLQALLQLKNASLAHAQIVVNGIA
jgi:hypothetical protein